MGGDDAAVSQRKAFAKGKWKKKEYVPPDFNGTLNSDNGRLKKGDWLAILGETAAVIWAG